MWGFIVALISGALMSIQGVFNTEVTKQTFVIKTSTSGHNVGIYIYRINRIADCNLII